MTRGGYNLAHKDGFLIETNHFEQYKKELLDMLCADKIEPITRTLLDRAAGIDAVAETKDGIIGISLRYRSKDFNSFTLSRHITDEHSEVVKWIKDPKGIIKPTYHIQIAEGINYVRITKIQIEPFRAILKALIESGELESFYNKKLEAYEFKHSYFKGVMGNCIEIRV